VSVLEIGESRESMVGLFSHRQRIQGELAVRVEVESPVDFTGRLETVLRSTDDPTWQPVDARNAAWLDVELDLVAHQKAVFDLLYDPVRVLGRYRGIVWRVRDHEGSLVASGFAQTARVDPGDEPLPGALYLTPLKSGGRRLAPADAYRVAFRYAPYRTILVESRTLTALEETQRQALLEATAFGRTLVVCGRADSLAKSIRDALALESSVIWRGEKSAELREAPLVFGVVRQFPGTVDELFELPEATLKLVELDSTVTPTQLEYHTFPVFLWPYIMSLEEEAEDMTAIRAVWPAIFGVALAALVVTWLAARTHPPVPRPVLIGMVVVTCVAAPVGYQLLAANPIGNLSQDGATVWHDAYGATQVRQVFSQRGGGGGTTPTEIHYQRSPSACWFPMSSGTRWRTVVESLDRGRIESVGLSSSMMQRLGFLGLYSEPAQPGWVGTAAWGPGGLSGHIRSSRDFESAVLVGFRGTATLGAVRAGQGLDLSKTDFRFGHDHLTPDDLALIADSWQARAARWGFVQALSRAHRPRVLTETEVLIVARDTSPPHLVHVQPIRVTTPMADAPPTWLKTLVPSTDLGTAYRLFVPETIFDSWRIGTEVRLKGTSFTVGEDLKTSRRDGFRIIEIEPAYRSAGDDDRPFVELRWCGGNWS
jgi:hypothetical protein